MCLPLRISNLIVSTWISALGTLFANELPHKFKFIFGLGRRHDRVEEARQFQLGVYRGMEKQIGSTGLVKYRSC